MLMLTLDKHRSYSCTIPKGTVIDEDLVITITNHGPRYRVGIDAPRIVHIIRDDAKVKTPRKADVSEAS